MLPESLDVILNEFESRMGEERCPLRCRVRQQRAGFSSDRPSGVPSALFKRGKIRKGEKKKRAENENRAGFHSRESRWNPAAEKAPSPCPCSRKTRFRNLGSDRGRDRRGETKPAEDNAILCPSGPLENPTAPIFALCRHSRARNASPGCFFVAPRLPVSLSSLPLFSPLRSRGQSALGRDQGPAIFP